MCFQWNLDEIDDLYQLIHAEQILSDLTLVKGNQNQIVDVFLLVLRGTISLQLENRHEFTKLFGC
jgi:hypothetical protein